MVDRPIAEPSEQSLVKPEGVALNDETVKQAIRRHERWLAEHEEAILKLDESRQKFWAAMKAATERGDRMDRRLERFEREGRRRFAEQAAKLERMDQFFQWFQNWIKDQAPGNGGSGGER